MTQSTNNILYRGDCKDALQKLIDKGIRIDLIYLDPPFNSSRTYNLIYNKNGVSAQTKAFHDMWTMTSQNEQMLLQFDEMLDTWTDLSPIIKNFLKAWISPLKNGNVEDQKMLIYLMYMTERLILMKKILKDTGLIYYHCDPTSSHYIKIIMDGLFGRDNFKNEIVWCYAGGGIPKMDFPRKHDILFRYSKNDNYYHNPPMRKYSEKGSGRHSDGTKYDKKSDLTPCNDWWNDLSPLNTQAKENIGYKTQKPIKLLDRIIDSSCPKDGIVLDPFCGCGTTIASAIKHNIDWIGIDISYDAVEVIKDRIKKQLGIDDKNLYEFIDGSPETRAEYDKLDPYKKQDWLIQKIGGFPNPKKSGDGGVDGDMTIHLGIDKDSKDKWGKMVFSVKTGKQCNPADLREVIGTMKTQKANMCGLILDVDPTQGMELTAQKQKQIEYIYSKELPSHFFDKVQIITSQEIIDGYKFQTPPTLKDIKLHRSNEQGTFSS